MSRTKLDDRSFRDFFDLSIEDRHPVIVEEGAFDSIEDEYEGDGGDSALQSDFERDGEIRREAEIGPNNERLDELDKTWHEAQLQDIEYAKQVPYVNTTTPPSWKTGVMGGVAVAKANQDTTLAGPEASVVWW